MRNASAPYSARGCPEPRPGRVPIGPSLSQAHSPAGRWILVPVGMLPERAEKGMLQRSHRNSAQSSPGPQAFWGILQNAVLARQVKGQGEPGLGVQLSL